MPTAGGSLQLIDPRQDNWRVGNWAAATPLRPRLHARSAGNSVAASLPPFPPLWINELQADESDRHHQQRRPARRPGWNFTTRAPTPSP